ncbi:hypothetical protein AVEN_27392-1 [Araneus ventricosus]|uniref:Uncharacterized protein n=1 Tax=Araneus ventricosus TaxID=182803 RepID=A0A4Y2NQB7_ARAVE|nr:hypothetical protein AVEN_27392-1 [Araneus ventricosus]
MVGSRTDFHIYPRGAVTAMRYRDDIFAQNVLPFFVAMDPDSVLMDDWRFTTIADEYSNSADEDEVNWFSRRTVERSDQQH